MHPAHNGRMWKQVKSTQRKDVPFLAIATIGNEDVVIVREATKAGYAVAVEGDSINLEQPNSKTRRGRVGKQVAQTLTTSPQQCVAVREKATAAAKRGRYNENGKIEKQTYVSDREYANALVSTQPKASLVAHSLRIRKLTPKECFRLMGFDDADYEKASAVNSNTQLYKQAGNSIGVPVVQHIFMELLKSGILCAENGGAEDA